jgi:hypothetical protein
MDNSKAIVIYESIYGNTHAIAVAIGEGLRQAAEVEVIRAADAPGRSLEGISLVVAGGPTHAHGLSRDQLREAGVKDAVAAGAEVDPAAEGPWLREWFEGVGTGSGWAASFDTRFDMPGILTGRASKGIMRRLERHGFREISEPESFLVDKDNHLLPGEEERARAWGASLADELGRRSPGLDGSRT